MSILRKIKYSIRYLFYFFNLDLRINKVTDRTELNRLLELLYPVQTNIELIRVGSELDGGYILPNDFDGVSGLFSPGVGNKQDFDLEVANLGIKVYMADYSVNGPNINHQNFNFIKKYLSSYDDNINITISSWFRDCKILDSEDLILQMDIEGSEWEVINNIPTSILNQFRIIIIEFHQVDLLLNQPVFDLISSVFKKLTSNHVVVHNHPNNCTPLVKANGISLPSVMEITLIRRDRVVINGYRTDFPHILDKDCTSEKSISLPSSLFASRDR